MSDSEQAFEHAVLDGRGRALVATRAIKPGQEVLREKPAAMVLITDNSVEDVHRMLAHIVQAAASVRFAKAIAELVCMQERFQAADAEMLHQLKTTGSTAVASLIAGIQICASFAHQMLPSSNYRGTVCNIEHAVYTVHTNTK
jgi:hypothetical protein